MLKLTLDTNCIINLLDYNSETATSVDQLAEIIRYAMEGSANITITTRVESDLKQDKIDTRREEMLRKVSMFPVIGTVARFGSTTWGNGDVYSDEKTSAFEDELKSLLFPGMKETDKHFSNKINDIDHLLGHSKSDRDVFVTDDRTILKKKGELESSYAIKVASPSEVVDLLGSQTNNNVLANEYYEKLKDYRDWMIEKVESDHLTEEDEEDYEAKREWLLKKTPKIIDSLANIDFRNNSVLVGTQRVFDQMQLVGMQNRQKRLQKLFSKSDLNDQLLALQSGDTDSVYYTHRPSGGPKKVIREAFKPHLDNLLSLIGSTE